MTTTLLSAFILGLFAGLAPGPYTTMVAGTALERGFKAGFILALTPMVTDIAPMLFSALLLERLGWSALTLLGIVGGAVILVVGIRFLRDHGPDPQRFRARVDTSPGAAPERRQSAQIGHVIASTLLNPSPWLFWLVVASPLLLRSLNRSTTEGVIFVIILFGTNMSTATALAWLASHGRKILNPAWQRRLLKAVGATLVLAGVLLLWQSYTGNFQSLVDQQGRLRAVLEDGLPPG